MKNIGINILAWLVIISAGLLVFDFLYEPAAGFLGSPWGYPRLVFRRVNLFRYQPQKGARKNRGCGGVARETIRSTNSSRREEIMPIAKTVTGNVLVQPDMERGALL